MKTRASVPTNSAITCWDSFTSVPFPPRVDRSAAPPARFGWWSLSGRRIEWRVVKILVVSADPETREAMALAARSVQRTAAGSLEVVEAKDGVQGMHRAWLHRPEVV